MIDARNVYRKVTRKIYDFSPEQQQNLQAIVWLYRGEGERFLELVARYLGQTMAAAAVSQPVAEFQTAMSALREKFAGGSLSSAGEAMRAEFDQEFAWFAEEVEQFDKAVHSEPAHFKADLNAAVQRLQRLADASRDLIKQSDLIYKLATRLLDEIEQAGRVSDSVTRPPASTRDLGRSRKAADEARQGAVEQLKLVRYFWKQAHWLCERFPEATLRDVAGLVRLVTIDEIAANDWSLTPGRYVGVAPEEVDEAFDFEETMREIHVELEDLNREAITLAATIKRNFEELGI
jgi:type I restriction enzyme M protein